MFRKSLALLLAPLLLGLGGCLFDQPLTSPPVITSPNLDSRLFGVFEFSQARKPKPGAEAKPDDVDIQRLAVLPLGPNRCVIYFRDFSKKPLRTFKFLGWLSRVDSVDYLSFRDDTEGSADNGKYGFFKYQWQFPGDILLFAPDLKDSEHATSPFAMRRALRAKLKAGTAFPFEATTWKKIARVWWDPAGAKAGATIPPEFERGTKVKDLAL